MLRVAAGRWSLEVERERADYGVVPIENSTEGVVNLTLDMFIESPLQICAEVMLEISHSLLSQHDRLEDIRTVYSHPQALAQCYSWLNKNLAHAEVKEVFSTAMAAKLALEEQHTAAIASEFAASLYELKVVKKRIEDQGIAVVTVEADELAKAEGAVTCCSLILQAATCVFNRVLRSSTQAITPTHPQARTLMATRELTQIKSGEQVKIPYTTPKL